jgi:hypothetical protein
VVQDLSRGTASLIIVLNLKYLCRPALTVGGVQLKTAVVVCHTAFGGLDIRLPFCRFIPCTGQATDAKQKQDFTNPTYLAPVQRYIFSSIFGYTWQNYESP